MLTLKTYAHAIREEEMDLSFADLEVRDCSKRLYPDPTAGTDDQHKSAPDLTSRGRLHFLEHETGLEPATPTLATCSDPWIPLRFPTKPPQGAALGTPA